MTIALGTIVGGDYRVVRHLGAGGMGVVYVAEQLSTGSLRAVKVLNDDIALHADQIARFVNEARLAARIKSEHVVQVIGAGRQEGSGAPWLAMELLEGEDLGAYLKRRGALSVAATRAIIAQLCHALAAAHAERIVHRDLKPANIFLARARREGATFTVKLLDLGIAKLIAEARVTTTMPVGTPIWMAPEQSELDGHITPATDVWALGLVVFYMLTGRYYWRAANAPNATSNVVLRELLFDPLAPASDRAMAVGATTLLPVGLDGWFARCVARDPGQRFVDAAAARTALEVVWDAAAAGPGDAEIELATPNAIPRVAEPHAPAPAAHATSSGASTSIAFSASEMLAKPSQPLGRRRRVLALAGGALTAVAIAVFVVLRLGASPPPDAETPTAPQASRIASPERSWLDPQKETHVAQPQRTETPAATTHPEEPATPLPRAAVPPPPASSRAFDALVSSGGPAAFDALAFVPAARTRARELAADADLVMITTDGAPPNGRWNLAATSSLPVVYRFRGASRPSAPAASESIRCIIYVVPQKTGAIAYAVDSSPSDCARPLVRTPRCAVAELWRRARAAGAPETGVVALAYQAATALNWSFAHDAQTPNAPGSQHLFDADSPGVGLWLFTLKVAGERVFSEYFDDDCGAAPTAPVPASATVAAAYSLALADQKHLVHHCVRGRFPVALQVTVAPSGRTIAMSAPGHDDAAARCLAEGGRRVRFPPTGRLTHAELPFPK